MDRAARSICQFVVTVLVAITLAACGGGAGDVVVPVAGTTLFTTAPISISLIPGAQAEYQVGGGGAGTKFTSYSASSSNTSVATAVLSGNDFIISAAAPGGATISVSDSTGASVSIAVTVTLP